MNEDKQLPKFEFAVLYDSTVGEYEVKRFLREEDANKYAEDSRPLYAARVLRVSFGSPEVKP